MDDVKSMGFPMGIGVVISILVAHSILAIDAAGHCCSAALNRRRRHRTGSFGHSVFRIVVQPRFKEMVG